MGKNFLCLSLICSVGWLFMPLHPDTDMRFRPVAIADAALLLAWRNDPLTRAMSITTHDIDPETHQAWLAASLKNPFRQLYIALLGNEPIGTMRRDTGHNRDELSWSLGPEARGQGLGRKMLAAFINAFPGQYLARIKPDNEASIKMVLHCGFHFDHNDTEGLGVYYNG